VYVLFFVPLPYKSQYSITLSKTFMFLNVHQISKTFGQEQVLRNCNLTIERQPTLSILGRSGSGKTTLLKILAGLEQPDTGGILLEGQRINDWSPQRRNMIYLYQEALLFPHLNVFENVAFGLRLQKQDSDFVRTETRQMLESLELAEQAQKRPEQLSGGQRQRVAFGRALIVNPKVLLLDEPFGALDTGTRENMQQLLKKIVHQQGITTLFVTHDLKEAIRMGDKIATMQNGQLEQYTSKQHFINDSSTGVQAEIDFWKNL